MNTMMFVANVVGAVWNFYLLTKEETRYKNLCVFALGLNIAAAVLLLPK